MRPNGVPEQFSQGRGFEFYTTTLKGKSQYVNYHLVSNRNQTLQGHGDIFCLLTMEGINQVWIPAEKKHLSIVSIIKSDL